MSKRLLKAVEAAEFLGVKKSMIYALTKAGDLPVVVLANSFRYDLADLDQYVESRKVPQLAKAVSEKNREAGLLGQQELHRRREAEAA